MEQQTHVRGEVKMQVLQYQISNQHINDIEDICFGCRCKELVCLCLIRGTGWGGDDG